MRTEIFKVEGAGLLPSFDPVVLLEYLSVKPVEEDKAISKEQNPGENCECFIKALQEWRMDFFSPANLGKDVG